MRGPSLGGNEVTTTSPGWCFVVSPAIECTESLGPGEKLDLESLGGSTAIP